MEINQMDERGQAKLGELLQRQGYAVVDGGLATQLERLGADLNGPSYPPQWPHTTAHDLRSCCARLGARAADSLWSARLLLDSGGAAMIKAVHRAYLDAGADVVITSSYQASIEGFRQRGLGEDDVRRLFQRTLQLAHVRRSFHHYACVPRACVRACVVCAVRVVCASDIKLTWRNQQEARAEFWADEERRRGRAWPLVAASIGPYGTLCRVCRALCAVGRVR